MPQIPSEHRILNTEHCAEHSYGPSSATLKLTNEFLATHSLGEILPYRSFDPETQTFVNRSSIGFVIEKLPFLGCGGGVPRQLTGLFQHSFPLGSNLQCLLIASSRVGPTLKTWEERRHSLLSHERQDVLQELAKERVSYLKSLWQAEDLIRGLDELLNPSAALETLPLTWNPYDSLSNQLMSPETRFCVKPSQLVIEGENIQRMMRLYTTRLLPPLWHLGAMGNLIGDPFNEFLRLKGNFFLSYGIHICHEPTLKTKMLAKCGNVEKQAASPIAKYVPSLRKEAEEWHYVREKFDGGQRLVRTRFQVGLISDPQHIKSEEQTLHNLT